MLASLATDFCLFSFAGCVSFLRHLNKSLNRDTKYNSISVLWKKLPCSASFHLYGNYKKNELYVDTDTDHVPSYQKQPEIKDSPKNITIPTPSIILTHGVTQVPHILPIELYKGWRRTDEYHSPSPSTPTLISLTHTLHDTHTWWDRGTTHPSRRTPPGQTAYRLVPPTNPHPHPHPPSMILTHDGTQVPHVLPVELRQGRRHTDEYHQQVGHA